MLAQFLCEYGSIPFGASNTMDYSNRICKAIRLQF
jgi:hypothetical protein